MKRLLVIGLALTVFTSPCFAFFPVGAILDLAAQETARSAAETPSPAFMSMIDIFNKICEKQIDEKQAREIWKAIGGDFDTLDSAAYTFRKILRAKRIDEEDEGIEIGYSKNNYSSYFSRNDILFSSADELREDVEAGRILFVHIDEESAKAQKDISSDMIYSFVKPLMGYGAAGSISRAVSRQMDAAIVVTGTRNGKAVIETPEGEKELSFDYLLEVSDYIMGFTSPLWLERMQATQDKSETDSYMEQLRKEVKQEKTKQEEESSDGYSNGSVSH